MTSSGPTVGNGWGDTASLGNIPGHVYGREVLRCYDWQAWVCSKLDEHGCTFKYARTHPLFIRCGKDCACQDGGKDKTKQCVACVWCTYAILGTCVHMRTDELAHTHARTPHTHAHTHNARARAHTHITRTHTLTHNAHTHARALSISLSLFSISSSKRYVVLTPIVSHAYPNDAERLYRVSHFVVTLQCCKGIHHYPTISLWQVYAAALEVDCRRLARDGSSGSWRVYILSLRFVPIHQP